MHLKRTVSDLWRAFEVQKTGLEVSIEAFDRGMKGEAARLANSAFLLGGPGMKTHKSILDQLGIHDHLDFVTTTSETQLVHLRVTAIEKNEYAVELLPKGLHDVRLVRFKEWWNEMVLRDASGREVPRAQIIRILRDKDGGAHFQEIIKDHLVADVLQGKLTGFQYHRTSDEPARPVPYCLETIMRQIAEELRSTIRCLKPNS